jgi:hypothetical protein
VNKRASFFCLKISKEEKRFIALTLERVCANLAGFYKAAFSDETLEVWR